MKPRSNITAGTNTAMEMTWHWDHDHSDEHGDCVLVGDAVEARALKTVEADGRTKTAEMSTGGVADVPYTLPHDVSRLEQLREKVRYTVQEIGNDNPRKNRQLMRLRVCPIDGTVRTSETRTEPPLRVFRTVMPHMHTRHGMDRAGFTARWYRLVRRAVL